MTTSVRLPPRIEQMLAAYCVEHQRSKSEVIVELLERHLAASESEGKAWDAAVAAGFIGCVEGAGTPSGDLKAEVRAAIRAKHRRS